EVVAEGLTYPTGIAIADDGTLYVTEAGYAYGAEPGRARLLEIAPDGSSRVLAEGDNPPWNGITLNDGVLYVAGGHVREGEVLRVSMDGRVTPLVTELPSLGDHHTNGPVIGPDGQLYFSQGSATNAAVVGVDNHDFGWLAEHPGSHDVPCEDITLAGR